MKKLILLLFVGILPLIGFGQNSAIVSWNGRLINNAPSFKPTFLTNTTDAGISSAALTAQDISSTGVGTLSVVSWESFYGVGWPTGSNVDSEKYFSLTVSPKANYQLAVSKLVLKYKGNNAKMRVSYSKNASFTNPTNIDFANLNIYSTPTIVQVNFPTTVNVTSSETLYIRIYGYNNAGNPGNGNINNRNWSLQFNANEPSSNVGPTLFGTVTYSPVPQAPVANSDTVSTLKNVVTPINVLANDTYSTLSAITVTQLPTNGTIQVNGFGNITYTPNTNFIGNDTFKYKLVDNIGTSNIATVSIAVNQPTSTPLVRWNGANLQPNGFLIVNDGSISANPVAGNFVTDNYGANPFSGFRGSNYNTSPTTPDYNNFMEFAIKANGNNVIDLTEFKFTHARGDGGPQKFEIRYSTDNSIGTAIGGITSVTSTPTLKTVNLSGITVQSGQTLYIRVYPFNRQNVGWNGGTFHIKHGTDSVGAADNGTGPTISGIVSAISDPITTWNGASGWSNGIPTITRDAIIQANYEIAPNETLNANNLTINAGATLTVASNAVLVVQNNITVLSNEGSTTPQLVIENNGSFVQVNDDATYTGAINSFQMKRKTQPVFRLDYTYWSSPVKENSGFTLSNLSPQTMFNKFLKWNHAGTPQAWQVVSNGNEVMVPGRGYLVRAPQNYNVEGAGAPQEYAGAFIGTPNNGVITHAVSGSTTANRWNLIGNPYPSAIDAETFLNENSEVLGGTLYFWTHNSAFSSASGYAYTASDYASWNLSGGTGTTTQGANENSNLSIPTGKIAAGQSFFVQGVSEGNATAVFNNSMRVTQGNLNNQFFRPSPSQPVENWEITGKHRVWLNLTSTQNHFNQILVGYIENATNGLDNSYDGGVFSGGAVSLYSILDSKNLTIQGRALPFSNQDEVPLGYKTTLTGTLKISIDHFDGLFEGQNVYLKDNLLNIVHNLKDSDYEFTTVPGTFNDRFVLQYLPQETLGTDVPTINTNSIVVFNNNNQINIKSSEQVISKVEIYDLQGRVIFTKNNIDGQSFATQSLSVKNQLVIVKVITDNNSELVKKVMLK